MTATNKIVFTDNLDTSVFKIDESAKKIKLVIAGDGKLELGSDGLKLKDDALAGYAKTSEVDSGAVTQATLEGNSLKLKNKSGSELSSVDLTGLVPTKDFHVTGGTLEGTQLTLTLSDSGSPVTINLGDLAKVTTGAGSTGTVTLSGDGSSANALKADIALHSDNKLLTTDGGLNCKVPTVHLVDAFGEEVGYLYAADQIA